MRPAARLLLAEAAAVLPILERTDPAAFERPTVCTGWSVRDVLAHCGAALTAVASGDVHRFTPEDNERDVDSRRQWPLDQVIDELRSGYEEAAIAVDTAGGRLDGVALGEWVHGGDVRAALGEPAPYASAGIQLALGLLGERSRALGAPEVMVDVAGRVLPYGVATEARPPARLVTDAATFVRLCGGRRPDPARYELQGAEPEELVLFS